MKNRSHKHTHTHTHSHTHTHTRLVFGADGRRHLSITVMVCSEGNDAAVAAVVAAAAAAAAMTDPDGVGVVMGSKKDAIMNTQFPFEGPSCLAGVYALGTALYAWVQWTARRSILKTSSPAQELDLCVVSDDIPESDSDDCEVCLLHCTHFHDCVIFQNTSHQSNSICV